MIFLGPVGTTCVSGSYVGIEVEGGDEEYAFAVVCVVVIDAAGVVVVVLGAVAMLVLEPNVGLLPKVELEPKAPTAAGLSNDEACQVFENPKADLRIGWSLGAWGVSSSVGSTIFSSPSSEFGEKDRFWRFPCGDPSLLLEDPASDPLLFLLPLSKAGLLCEDITR